MMTDENLMTLRDQSWVVVENIFSPSYIQSLNRYGLGLRDQFNPAKIGEKGQFIREENWRRDTILWVDHENPSEELRPLAQWLAKFQHDLNQKLFLGLRYFEMHWAYYEPGAFYKRHRDTHKRDSQRLLTWILYLNPDWKSADGGELVIYHGDQPQIISPTAGRCVFFLSQEIEHEVLVTHRPRLSLTGWFHQKEWNGL